MTAQRTFSPSEDFIISAKAYEWTVRAISALRAGLGINIKMHRDEGDLKNGQIFLFNHFARFETFIPQYIIHQATGSHCRSVASSEFFEEDNAFSRYLLSLGAVPNTYERLLPFLAEEILRGRKVVIFPEGGMVKDRRVLDQKGKFSIYSRSAGERRKHHLGAAVLALTLDAFKIGIRENLKPGRRELLKTWADRLGMSGVGELTEAVLQPTLVNPSNITFYPIRVSENLLLQGAEFFSKGLSPQASEELMIEGNLLLRDTDMDIRLGDPIRTGKTWSWMERKLLGVAVRRISTLDDLFEANCEEGSWKERLVQVCIRKHVLPMRDAYMNKMYSEVSINLNHIVSRLILMYVDEGIDEIDRKTFHKTLYLAVKNAQNEDNIHLHRGIENPERYVELINANGSLLENFFALAERLELVDSTDKSYEFLPKLREEHGFDEIRVENPIVIYANEMAPIPEVWDAIKTARKSAATIDDKGISRLQIDDEIRSLELNKKYYGRNRYRKINDQETATADALPYFIEPDTQKSNLGVLIVHGFLASPAELKTLGERIAAKGHVVLGVRLQGHGTSPHDLQSRSWEDWLASVQRGYNILAPFCDQICIVGFSTGGTLAAIHAAELPNKLAGIVLASTPLKFRNKNLVFIPLLHGANKLVEFLSSSDGVMPFIKNDAENPDINYRHIPIRAVYELRQAVSELAGRLKDITCPVLILQGDNDTVVDPHSADLIDRKIGSKDKTLHMISTDRHGILCHDIGGAHEYVIKFIARFAITDKERLTA